MGRLSASSVLFALMAVACGGGKSAPSAPPPAAPAELAAPVAVEDDVVEAPPVLQKSDEEFSKELLTALGSLEKTALGEFALTEAGLNATIAMMKTDCPDGIESLRQMNSGADKEAKRRKAIESAHESCSHEADFDEADFIRFGVRDSGDIGCQAKYVNGVFIEATWADSSVYAYMTEAIRTPSGWRFVRELDCSLMGPERYWEE